MLCLKYLLRKKLQFIDNSCTSLQLKITYIFLCHWHEKIVFSRQYVDVLNPFIGCQQNWSKNTIFIMVLTWKVLYKSLSNRNFNVKKDNWLYLLFKTKFCSLHRQKLVWIKICPIIFVFTSIAIWKRLVIYYYEKVLPLKITNIKKNFGYLLRVNLCHCFCHWFHNCLWLSLFNKLCPCILLFLGLCSL